MTDSEIEAVIHGCGVGRLPLIESAFQADILWRNMAHHCGIIEAHEAHVRRYILMTFDPDGTRWRGPAPNRPTT